MSAMLLGLICVATAARLSLNTNESPVERVVTLLEDLQNQVQEEGTAEAETYEKFACFCKDKDGAKVESIGTRETEVQTLTADLEQLVAELAQLKADIMQLNTDLDTFEMDLKKMTEIRENEKAIYEAEYADASAAVSALNAAIKHIEGSKSLASVKTEVMKTLALAAAVWKKGSITLPPKLVKFLQQPTPPQEIPDEDYTFHSGGIIDTLNDLLKKFEERKSTLEADEEKAVKAFDEASASKREEIEAAKSTLATKEEQLSENESTTAEKTELKTETSALLHDDKTYLKDLTGQCETKAKEWDQRSKARAGELQAISTALELLGVVGEKEASTGAGGRSAPEGAEAAPKGEMPPMEGSPSPDKFLLQVGEDEPDADEYHDVVFAQTQQLVHRNGDATKVELRNRAITLLSKAGKAMKSSMLEVLAMQLAADPFAKVKSLIQQLIERLLREAADEATHKGWCDTEMGKAEKDREYREGDVAGLNAEIQSLEATKSQLEENHATLTEEVLQLNEDLTEATSNRDQDKANNKKTLSDAAEGLEALKQAITVLKDFYRKAGRNKVLLQASPVGEDMGAEGVEGGSMGAYKGNQGAASGIIGMLETIRGDFERTVSSTEAAEYQAGRDFAKFSQETKASIASKEKGLEQTANELEMTNNALVGNLNDLQETQGLLDSALKALETLRPACVDTGMTFEERVARREAEIDALKKALEVLSEGEDTKFLQK